MTPPTMENNSDKYHEFDKAITKEIMKEFEGQVVQHKCPNPNCREGWDNVIGGKGSLITCLECDGKGFIEIEY